MTRCKATTKAGKQCNNSAVHGSQYCAVHNKGKKPATSTTAKIQKPAKTKPTPATKPKTVRKQSSTQTLKDRVLKSLKKDHYFMDKTPSGKEEMYLMYPAHVGKTKLLTVADVKKMKRGESYYIVMGQWDSFFDDLFDKDGNLESPYVPVSVFTYDKMEHEKEFQKHPSPGHYRDRYGLSGTLYEGSDKTYMDYPYAGDTYYYDGRPSWKDNVFVTGSGGDPVFLVQSFWPEAEKRLNKKYPKAKLWK
jgi:hypothetical protein